MSDGELAGHGSRPSDNRISRLSAAILRISQSLDLATVLEEVVDSARALTSARQSMITTVDDRGRVQDVVTSGMTPDERRNLMDWPDGPWLFEHLRDLPAPLRVADLPGYLRSLGLSNPSSSKTLQGTPMHHRGEHLGNFFLGDKENGEAFTAEDEEILLLFASQAGTAIANARTHRDVERARADLEALVETSPVGVGVFDAATGRPVLFNREARRIAEGLRTPGRPTEHLFEVLTCRHADGREHSLEEFPLAWHLEGATTMRAEEVVLSVPDGRSVRTLLNVTPIRSEEGELVSVVTTVQDLAPLDDLERQRAGVSRDGEPRAPRAAHLDQGLDGDRARCLPRPAPGRAAPVLPHHRRAGGPHEGPHREPPRRREHRSGHAHHRARALQRRRARGSGPDHLSERGRTARRRHRPPAGPPAGDGRPRAHRPGAQQPLLERGPALATARFRCPFSRSSSFSRRA